MLEGIFNKRKYITVDARSLKNNLDDAQKPNIPTGLWIKCHNCGKTLYKNDLKEHHLVCPFCNTSFRMTADERLTKIIDQDTFREMNAGMASVNPLDFPGYDEKLEKMQGETGLNEAVITGIGKIEDRDTVIAVMDSRFMMSSMGSVVGEKITRAVEYATEKRLPIIIFTTSGGARMQEGIFSLMQMAKTSAALSRHSSKGLLYITVLTDPTTGGVTASFAMLGDIILAEPGTLVGFAGKRVIQQTIKQELPEDFQRAEFLLEHGFIDAIIERKDLKETLGKLLYIHREVL